MRQHRRRDDSAGWADPPGTALPPRVGGTGTRLSRGPERGALCCAMHSVCAWSVPAHLPSPSVALPLQLRRLELGGVRLAQCTPRLVQALSQLTFLSCCGALCMLRGLLCRMDGGRCAMPPQAPPAAPPDSHHRRAGSETAPACGHHSVGGPAPPGLPPGAAAGASGRWRHARRRAGLQRPARPHAARRGGRRLAGGRAALIR